MMAPAIAALCELAASIQPELQALNVMLDVNVYEQLKAIQPKLTQNTMRVARIRKKGTVAFYFFGEWYWDRDYVECWKDKLRRRDMKIWEEE